MNQKEILESGLDASIKQVNEHSEKHYLYLKVSLIICLILALTCLIITGCLIKSMETTDNYIFQIKQRDSLILIKTQENEELQKININLSK